jgi:hypothetical protein
LWRAVVQGDPAADVTSPCSSLSSTIKNNYVVIIYELFSKKFFHELRVVVKDFLC